LKQFRDPPDVHTRLAAYTHQIKVTGPTRLLVMSGQVGQRKDGAVPDEPLEQLEVALANVAANLAAAGNDRRSTLD